MMNKLEAAFQSDLKKEIEGLLTDCVVLVKPGFTLLGFPDLLILYKNQWAALEVKRSEHEEYQPGQEWWIGELNAMSYSAMICPENRKEIIGEMVRSLT